MNRIELKDDELENIAMCVQYCVDQQEDGHDMIVEDEELPDLKKLADRLANLTSSLIG